MKEITHKRRALLRPAAFFVLCGLVGCAREWQPVMRTADMDVELDTTTVQRRGPVVTMTIKVLPSNATTYRVVTQQLYCGRHAYRLVRSILYDFDRTMVPERADQPPVEFRPIGGDAGALQETLYQQVCK